MRQNSELLGLPDGHKLVFPAAKLLQEFIIPPLGDRIVER